MTGENSTGDFVGKYLPGDLIVLMTWLQSFERIVNTVTGAGNRARGKHFSDLTITNFVNQLPVADDGTTFFQGRWSNHMSIDRRRMD